MKEKNYLVIVTLHVFSLIQKFVRGISGDIALSFPKCGKWGYFFHKHETRCSNALIFLTPAIERNLPKFIMELTIECEQQIAGWNKFQ